MRFCALKFLNASWSLASIASVRTRRGFRFSVSAPRTLASARNELSMRAPRRRRRRPVRHQLPVGARGRPGCRPRRLDRGGARRGARSRAPPAPPHVSHRTLHRRFEKPVPIERPLEARAWVARREPRKWSIAGELVLASSEAVLARADGIFVLRDQATHFGDFKRWLAEQEVTSERCPLLMSRVQTTDRPEPVSRPGRSAALLVRSHSHTTSVVAEDLNPRTVTRRTCIGLPPRSPVGLTS